jgi:hypothetical protein
MKKIVVVIARAAADSRRFFIYQRHDGVRRYTFALDAKIVNVIAKA